MAIVVKLKPFDKTRFFHVPSYSSSHSAGQDIKACLDFPLEIEPHQTVLVPTNLCVEIPPYFINEVPKIKGVFGEKIEYERVSTGLELELQVRPKSGYSTKKQLIITNSPGTIDSDYRGEIKVSITNVGTKTRVIFPEESFAQLVLAPVVRFEWEVTDQEFSETDRGEKGFGEQTSFVQTVENDGAKVFNIQGQDTPEIRYPVNMFSFQVYTKLSFCLKCGCNTLIPDLTKYVDDDDLLCKTCKNCQNEVVTSKKDYKRIFDGLNQIAIGHITYRPKYPDIEKVHEAIKELETFGGSIDPYEMHWLINTNIPTPNVGEPINLT